MRTKSSQCDPDELGYTRATMKITKSNKKFSFKLIFKSFPSSDCELKLVHMKLESLVIANKHVAVNCQLALYTPPVTCRESVLLEDMSLAISIEGLVIRMKS